MEEFGDREIKSNLLDGMRIVHDWSESLSPYSNQDTSRPVYLREILKKQSPNAFSPIGCNTAIDQDGRCVGEKGCLKARFTRFKVLENGTAFLFVGFGQDWYCMTNDLYCNTKVLLGGPRTDEQKWMGEPKECDLFYVNEIKIECRERSVEFYMSLLEPGPESEIVYI